MFQKFTPQAFTPETKSQIATVKGKNDETGEPDNTEVKPIETKKQEKPMTNLFGMKSSTPLTTSSQNVPDVLKTSPLTLNKIEKPVPKPVENVLEKSQKEKKENIPETGETVAQKGDADKKENIIKPFATAVVKPSLFASGIPSVNSTSDVPGTLKGRYLFFIYYYQRFFYTNFVLRFLLGKQEKSGETTSETQTVPEVSETSDSKVNSSVTSLFAAANAATGKNINNYFMNNTYQKKCSSSYDIFLFQYRSLNHSLDLKLLHRLHKLLYLASQRRLSRLRRRRRRLQKQ